MHNLPGFPPIAHEQHHDMMEGTVLFPMLGLFCLLNLYQQWNADVGPLLHIAYPGDGFGNWQCWLFVSIPSQKEGRTNIDCWRKNNNTTTTKS